MDWINQFGGLGRRVSSTIYEYDSNLNLIKEEFYDDEKDDNPMIYKYEYKDDLLFKKEFIYDIQPQANNSIHFYYYNKDKLLTETHKINNSKKDTLISWNKYNSNGNIDTKYNKTNAIEETIKYKYNDNGDVISEEAKGAFQGRSFNSITTYVYNSNGKLIEDKTITNGEIRSWKKHKYNESGLRIEEINIDNTTGKPRSSIKIKYFM